MMLKNSGIKVTILKLDPYLNVDPGTMSPLEHGEVFVTSDGCETDLDLGHYERFLNQDLTALSNVTAGQVYKQLISLERRGDNFLGQTVQVVPHFVSALASRIRQLAEESDAEVVIVEVGGTVGDMEAEPFIEAIRWMRENEGIQNSFCLHLTLVPFLDATSELKTKPTQHSVRQLRGLGIHPDAILCRLNAPVGSDDEMAALKQKLSLHCGVSEPGIIYLPTLPHNNVYAVPAWLEQQGLISVIAEHLGFPGASPEIPPVWRALSEHSSLQVRVADDKADGETQESVNGLESVRIGMVGKYTRLHDSYLSVVEALRHSSVRLGVKVDIIWVPADLLESEEASEHLSGVQGIIVPGGFDVRGSEGMIRAARFARERSVPYFGLCLGLQTMIIEFARHVAGIEGATSREFDPFAEDAVIDLMDDQREVAESGGTMRLGDYACSIEPGTIAYESYAAAGDRSEVRPILVHERHRHRYEYNNSYRDVLEPRGLISSGMNPNLGLVEIAEIEDHPFMLGSQFHPEFRSRPERPHPLFDAFLQRANEFETEGMQRRLMSQSFSGVDSL